MVDFKCEKCNNMRVLVGRGPNNEAVSIFCMVCWHETILNKELRDAAQRKKETDMETVLEQGTLEGRVYV